MNIVQIEENVKQLIHKIAHDELNKQDFIYELLLAYGHRSQSIGRVRNGERNLAEDKETTVFWKRQIYFKIAKQHDLHGLIDQMKGEKRTESNKIRFLIVTDFKTLLAVDTKTQDTLDVPFSDLAKKFDFFLPWAGMEKAVYQGENPADVKAAEKLAKLFDEIKADNFDEDDLNNKENLHQLNIFLSRLLFCYFAEDTEIFKDKQFTSAISKSKEDGSDLSALIGRLFKVLNQSTDERDSDLPEFLSDFPYVNGGLFKDDIQVPKFTRKSRRILIECGAELDWSDINPDIFGSMFQAVVHTEQRSTMGQHYTSVPNIMKVIEPLFLNDLYEELEKNQDSINKLLKLQQRLGQMKIFDPACGSGNFLIIAYKELRKFEMELLKRIQELELEKTGQFSKPFSVIQVSQFYGIELDNFAHEVAILSLWLTEHQMNLIFKDEFGELLPSLPLKKSGNIILGNATRIDWSVICSNQDAEVYILGNPPYRGARQQDISQKSDIEATLKHLDGYKNLDFISIWFYKAAQIIKKNKNASAAFVSTNSITQGTQVNLLWSHILDENIGISFCHTSFKWTNNARFNAGVICVVIGLKNKSNLTEQYIYDSSNGSRRKANSITPYLTEGNFIFIEQRKKPLSLILPPINYGSFALDDGHLTLNSVEAEKLISMYPDAAPLIKKFIGAKELLQGQQRYCLWLNSIEQAQKFPLIYERINNVKKWRLASDRKSTVNIANTPYKFAEIRQPSTSYLAFPTISSESREYIPSQYFEADIIASNQIYIIPEAPLWLFAVLSSAMHMVWVRSIGGRLKSDIRYSSSLCYNTFPLPAISQKIEHELNEKALILLTLREKYSDKTLTKLYNPKSMPNDLKHAHLQVDEIVDKAFNHKGTASDESRLNTLLKLYEKSKSRG